MIIRHTQIFCLISACFLSSCSSEKGLDAVFANYAYRLENVFEVEFNLEPSHNSMLRYPSRRELRLPISSTKIDILQFLSLSKCDLQRHIGENNSGLGKVRSASQALIYDLEFIKLANKCIAHRESQSQFDELTKTLHEAVKLKQQELPLQQWNATFASVEFAHLFAFQEGVNHRQLEIAPSVLLQALASISHSFGATRFNQENASSLKDLETQLGVIVSEKYMGRLQSALLTTNQYLAIINSRLQARFAKKTMCPRNRAGTKAKVMHTVFLKYYIGEVQPFLALLDQRATAMVVVLQDLYQVVGIRQREFDAYWAGTWAEDGKSFYNDFRNNLETHRNLWQKVLDECGFLPGK